MDSLQHTLRTSIWYFGIILWMFGLTDRSLSSLIDGYADAVELTQLLTAFVLFLSWLALKPINDEN